MTPKPSKDEEYKTRRLIKSDTEKHLQELVISWIEESIADLVSIHLGGPGTFFAFLDQAMIEPSLDDYTKNEKYPSFRIRLIKMLEILNDLGFIEKRFEEWRKEKEKREVSRFFVDELKRWQEFLSLKKKESFKSAHHEKKIEIVKKCFLDLFPEIRGEVKKKLEEINKVTDISMFTIDEFEKEVFHLLDLIKKEISPNEIINRDEIGRKCESRPAKWASILNAGWLWLYLCVEKPSIYTEKYILGRKTVKNDLFLHITKAIERSEFHRKFLSIKTRVKE